MTDKLTKAMSNVDGDEKLTPIPYRDPDAKLDREIAEMARGKAPEIDPLATETFGPLPPATKQDILEEAMGTVIQRGATYDKPYDNFTRIARLWNVHVLNRYGVELKLDALDVATMQGYIKDGRLAFSPLHHDSHVDKSGYGACGGEIAAYMRHLEGKDET